MKRFMLLSVVAISSIFTSDVAFGQVAKQAVSSSTFTSPQGFSITAPNGWAIAGKDVTDQIAATVHDEVGSAAAASGSFAVVIFNSADPTHAQNINVVVSESAVPIDEAGIEGKIEKVLRDQYSKIGITISNVSVTKKTFGSHEGLVANVDSNMTGTPIRQWQVFFPSANQTLIVTCTAPPSSFDSATPAFTQALTSMVFPKPNGHDVFPSWATGAAIGLGVGLGLAITRKMKARK